jgi:pimeloyl-ACP methyl ester carboxylesterase
MLIEHGVRLRPDWETVVRAVVDAAVTIPIVDPTRIALSGWSLGGYLAPRAASGEHRLAACIADPGLWSIASGLRGYAVKLGISREALVNIGEIDEGLLNRIWQIIRNDRRLWWSIVQRGFWVNGVKNLRDYLRCVEEFTMDERAGQIRCPMLLTQAEEDPLARDAEAFFDALRCPKTFIRFTSAEGAGDHCEMKNRSLFNRRVFDWLDMTLGTSQIEHHGTPVA